MKHIFDIEVAKVYGVNAAIILENIGYWIKQNEANKMNFYDENYWTFNSRRAYKEIFPYMSERQIETAFRKLIDDGLIITGNYNALAYDRTLWYALTQKGKSILHFDGMDYYKMQNGEGQNVPPIPNITPNNKQIINNKEISKETIAAEFENLWELYPRKIGKTVALKHYIKARKNGATFEEVKAGVKAYAEYVKGKDKQYIKHGGTWFSQESWKDELDTKSEFEKEREEMCSFDADEFFGKALKRTYG